jgi:hypothetical protein
MSDTKIDLLYKEYSEIRFLDINKEQFVYLVNLMPVCLLATSDGIMDKEEWATVKSLTKILGEEFASDDLGQEKEENLMLIYRGEMRYLVKHRDKWQGKFTSALREYFSINEAAKDFVEETIELFEDQTEEAEVSKIKNALGLK